MSKWMLRRKSADYLKIAERFNINPLIAMILVNRGVETEEDLEVYLNGGEEVYDDPFKLKDMDILIEELKVGLRENRHILIVGDYDVDGVCASAILKKGIEEYKKNLGSSSAVDIRIPHRVHDGYGLSVNIIEEAVAANVDILITCDNGISAVEEIKMAESQGITVLVTDHHEIPFEADEDGNKKYIYPPAKAIVDPKRPDSFYGFTGLCGAYVAYKVINALLGEGSQLLPELREIAAVATVADIMELRGENRVLVKEGLKSLNNPKNTGLRGLVNKLGIEGADMASYHIGFIIGPSINAAGRLETADYALELLLEEDYERALEKAEKLAELNEERKRIQENAIEAACGQIESSEEIEKVLVVYSPECHESVAGIVAGKLKEMYKRPVLVITDAAGEGEAKGSARSIEAYNMYDELTKVSDIFIKYGGHAMAAGFSLPLDKIDELRERLNANCDLVEDDFTGIIKLDAAPPLSYITPDFVNQLAVIEPTGQGNESVKLAVKDIVLIGGRTFGENGITGKYRVKDTNGGIYEFTLFRRNAELREYLADKYGEEKTRLAFSGREELPISFVYHPKWNEYRGVREIQFIVDDYC